MDGGAPLEGIPTSGLPGANPQQGHISYSELTRLVTKVHTHAAKLGSVISKMLLWKDRVLEVSTSKNGLQHTYLSGLTMLAAELYLHKSNMLESSETLFAYFAPGSMGIKRDKVSAKWVSIAARVKLQNHTRHEMRLRLRFARTIQRQERIMADNVSELRGMRTKLAHLEDRYKRANKAAETAKNDKTRVEGIVRDLARQASIVKLEARTAVEAAQQEAADAKAEAAAAAAAAAAATEKARERALAPLPQKPPTPPHRTMPFGSLGPSPGPNIPKPVKEGSRDIAAESSFASETTDSTAMKMPASIPTGRSGAADGSELLVTSSFRPGMSDTSPDPNARRAQTTGSTSMKGGATHKLGLLPSGTFSPSKGVHPSTSRRTSQAGGAGPSALSRSLGPDSFQVLGNSPQHPSSSSPSTAPAAHGRGRHPRITFDENMPEVQTIPNEDSSNLLLEEPVHECAIPKIPSPDPLTEFEASIPKLMSKNLTLPKARFPPGYNPHSNPSTPGTASAMAAASNNPWDAADEVMLRTDVTGQGSGAKEGDGGGDSTATPAEQTSATPNDDPAAANPAFQAARKGAEGPKPMALPPRVAMTPTGSLDAGGSLSNTARRSDAGGAGAFWAEEAGAPAPARRGRVAEIKDDMKAPAEGVALGDLNTQALYESQDLTMSQDIQAVIGEDDNLSDWESDDA